MHAYNDSFIHKQTHELSFLYVRQSEKPHSAAVRVQRQVLATARCRIWKTSIPIPIPTLNSSIWNNRVAVLPNAAAYTYSEVAGPKVTGPRRTSPPNKGAGPGAYSTKGLAQNALPVARGTQIYNRFETNQHGKTDGHSAKTDGYKFYINIGHQLRLTLFTARRYA